MWVFNIILVFLEIKQYKCSCSLTVKKELKKKAVRSSSDVPWPLKLQTIVFMFPSESQRYQKRTRRMSLSQWLWASYSGLVKMDCHKMSVWSDSQADPLTPTSCPSPDSTPEQAWCSSRTGLSWGLRDHPGITLHSFIYCLCVYQNTTPPLF